MKARNSLLFVTILTVLGALVVMKTFLVKPTHHGAENDTAHSTIMEDGSIATRGTQQRAIPATWHETLAINFELGRGVNAPLIACSGAPKTPPIVLRGGQSAVLSATVHDGWFIANVQAPAGNAVFEVPDTKPTIILVVAWVRALPGNVNSCVLRTHHFLL